jgi:hypothetical protein
MKNNDVVLIEKFPILRSLAEDLESTLSVIAYSNIKNVIAYVMETQNQFKKDYGIRIDCGRYGSIYCGKPNTLFRYTEEKEPDVEKRIAKVRDNCEMLSINTWTTLECVYTRFMQILSHGKKKQDIIDESEDLLQELVGATGGLVIPLIVPEEMSEDVF